MASLPCARTRTCRLHTQRTGNQANFKVEWCVVIFDRHDYPAELVRKRSVIKLGEHTHQKAVVQSGLGAYLSQTGWLACRLCFNPVSMFNQTSVFVCFTIVLIRLVKPNQQRNESMNRAQKNNRTTVLMVDEHVQPFKL